MGWGARQPVDEHITRAEAEGVLRRLWRMLGPYRRAVVVAGVAIVAQTACMLAGPALVRHGIDAGLREGDAGALNTSAALFLAVSVAALLLGRLVINLVANVGETFLRDLRGRVFRHLVRLGLDFYESERTGRLVSRMTSDIDAMQELTAYGLVMFVQSGLLFVGAVVVIVTMSWQLALCTLLVVPPVVWASRWFRRESNKAYLKVRDRIGQNLTTLQEGLAGVRVVQAFGQEDHFLDRFRTTNEAQYEANIETARVSTRYFPVVEYAGVAGMAVIIGVGGFFVDRDVVTVGTLAAFVLYLNSLFEPVQQLSQLFNVLQSAGAALHKLFGLLDTAPSVAERPGAVDLPRHGDLEVDHVSFAYGRTDVRAEPGAPPPRLVLHDVSLRVRPGERVALVGPTGAGKSTLAKLAARLYDPRVGAVRLGGVDLRDGTLSSLRERIVVVPQEGFLFAGTLRDNVRVGRPEATDGEVDAAVAALGLAGRFAALPDGLDTEVHERGSSLSAGERQLVSLARAALADPAVLVLDEATSNLDPGTEEMVERALDRLTEGRSVLVIAHRLSTAARADRVAVVDDGRLLELGTHDELLARGGRYAQLYAAWDHGQALGRPA